MGIVEVIGEYRPDPTDEKDIFGLVVVQAVKDVPRHVTLADCKANPKLADMGLVKSSRLSVQPVTPQEWKIVCAMGGLKADKHMTRLAGAAVVYLPDHAKGASRRNTHG